MKSFLLSLALLLAVPVFAQTTRVKPMLAGTTSYTDSTGNVWLPDTGFYNAGNVGNACQQATTSGPDPVFYHFQRIGTAGNPDTIYTFPNLTNGNYSVSLYFNECAFGSVGARIFSVNANSAATPQIQNLDVFAAVGTYTPLVKTFTVAVTANVLTFDFIPVSGNPLITGIAFTPLALPVVATPTFSPVAGAYTSIQSVTISDSTAGSSIFYTTNGTAPTTASTPYSGPISVGVTETIQAIATASGSTQSAVGSAAYTITLPPPNPPAIATATATITLGISCNSSAVPPPASHSVSLTWVASTTTDVTSYNVYRGTVSGGPYTKIASSLAVLNYTDLTVVSGTTYYYVATAVDVNGESGYSNQASSSIP
jgi:Malectin domain/Chitobiase/beta-hexosaminidase C-terminal domain